MEYIENIKELASKNVKLNLNFIERWLKDNTNILNKAIEKTECHKWKKWQRDNSLHIFPCLPSLCGTRNEECCFIEFYKNLQDFIQTIRAEEFYKKQLDEYNKIKHNQKAIFEWIIAIENYGKELILINDEIYFKNEIDKKFITFELDKTELPNLWNFKEVFEENYHSLDFDNYINN